jgi:predicted aspartyl protease
MRILGLVMALAACSGGGIHVSGPLGSPIQGATHGNVMYLQVGVDGTMVRPLAVDTGAPVTVLDPNAFADLMLPAGESHHTFAAAPLTFTNVPAVSLSPCGMMMCSDQQLDGLFGGNILRDDTTTFNYRDQQLVIGPLTLPSGVEPTGAIKKFDLQGGGLGMLQGVSGTISFPPTRVSLNVTIEGVDHPFILDSGASLVVLDPKRFDQIAADGRATTQVGALTTMGMGTSKAMRLKSIVVAGAEVQGAPTLSSPLDLSALAAEVGHPIEGLLGGTYLREFLVTIDYPALGVQLRRYDTRDHIHDEFDRVGVLIGRAPDGSYGAAYVFPGSNADDRTNTAIPACFFGSGSSVSEIVSVDGTALAGMQPDDADTLLRGTPGAMHTLAVKKACDGSAAQMAFLVQDVLPVN